MENHPPRPLEGGCSCGRNRYKIHILENPRETPQVLFSDDNPTHRHPEAPSTTYLRIPLSWYHSTTHAFMADETPSSIRRVYTDPDESHGQRHFCGYCGMGLSYWSESPATEAEYICLTMGSLHGEDLHVLKNLGLLPKEAVKAKEGRLESIEENGGGDDGEDSMEFKSMVEGGRIGKMMKSWGSRQSGNGRFNIEWEIVEWTEGDGYEEMGTPGKRKFGEVAEEVGDDVMEGVH